MVRYARSFRRGGRRFGGGRRFTKQNVGAAVGQIVVGLILLWVASKIIDVVANYQVNASSTGQCLSGCSGINVTTFGSYSTWLTPVLPIIALLIVILPIVKLVRGKLF